MNEVLNHIFQKENRWQILFWGIILFSAPVAAAIDQHSLFKAFYFRLGGLITKMLAGYIMAYYIFPRFLFRRRYLSAFVSFAVLVVAAVILARLINVQIVERLVFEDVELEGLKEIVWTEFSYTFDAYFGRVFGMATLFVFVKIGVDQLRSQSQLAQLREEKATAELNFLKAQIHPHFLFNTLNNLYTLTLEKSDEAPGVVIKLSAMLDYLLYQCNSPRVAIQKEIELIENYLGLESLRYGDRLDLKFTHAVENPVAMIAPLLLISPIENAFKHGVSGATEQPKVEIDLRMDEEKTILRVFNSKPIVPPTDERAYTAGIGLENIRKQLELIYPERYELVTKEEKDTYFVQLVIQHKTAVTK